MVVEELFSPCDLSRLQTLLRFQLVSSSWVALHPHPKGIIQFVGGAFFGSFPTFYYRQFLSQLWAGGYSLIAFPFQFTFRHWPVAWKLLQEQAIDEQY